MPRKHAHYFRSVAHLNEVDIYRVLELFGVTDQALGHATKKIMLPGLRGAKATRKDIEEAIDTLQRKLEMMDEDACIEKSDEPEFIAWDGYYSMPPLLRGPGIVVDVVLRNGEKKIGCAASTLIWRHHGNASDIVGYRRSSHGL